MGARETALNVLIACRKNGAWSNGVLKEYLVRDHLDPRDSALATRLCYGVQQNRGKLDFYLQQLLTGKLKISIRWSGMCCIWGSISSMKWTGSRKAPQSMNPWPW